MSNYKSQFIAVIISLVSFTSYGSPETLPETLGFKDWKVSRISEARQALERLQMELDPNLPKSRVRARTQVAKTQPTGVVRVQKANRVDNRVSQAQTNLEIAQELSAHDYFVLYLSQLTTETEVQEAVKKLDPAEIAEIMIGIKNQLNADRTFEKRPIVTPTPGQRTSKYP